jgi:DNA-binding response OmpR family regulator
VGTAVGRRRQAACPGDQVKLYVGYLRRKLEPDAPESVPIETVRGFGYRYKTS